MTDLILAALANLREHYERVQDLLTIAAAITALYLDSLRFALSMAGAV